LFGCFVKVTNRKKYLGLFKNIVTFFAPAQLKGNANAHCTQHKFWHGFVRTQKRTPKIYFLLRLYTKDKKVNLPSKNLAYLLYIAIQRTFFVCAFHSKR